MNENNVFKKSHIFLGGTCNGSKWREELIPLLDPEKCTFFNPVVENWTEECQAEEIRQRENCDFCLYVLTPEMTGVYSVAEVVDDSNKRPKKTVMVVLEKYGEIEFTKVQAKSMRQVVKMVHGNGGHVFGSLQDVATYFNRL